MKKYKVPTRLIFEGDFSVVAESAKEARECVEKHCGLCLGGEIHTTMEYEVGWEFNTHAEKKIGRITIM